METRGMSSNSVIHFRNYDMASISHGISCFHMFSMFHGVSWCFIMISRDFSHALRQVARFRIGDGCVRINGRVERFLHHVLEVGS